MDRTTSSLEILMGLNVPLLSIAGLLFVKEPGLHKATEALATLGLQGLLCPVVFRKNFVLILEELGKRVGNAVLI